MRILAGFMILVGAVGGVFAEDKAVDSSVNAGEAKMLLERLNLDAPGLEKVKAAAGEPERAAAELLAYFRARTTVKHPSVPTGKDAGAERPMLSKEVGEIADDALKNILVASPVFPRHDFGKEIAWLKNASPAGDSEWLWQLHRHYSWGALCLAYASGGDETYAQAYVRQLLDWMAKCPLDKGSPAWRTIEAGIRGQNWTEHFLRVLPSAAYTPDVLVKQMNSFHDHAAYLTGREMRTTNWGLMEAEGAAFVAMTFPEFKDAAVWREKAFKHLNAMMKAQVRADGMQYEQCLGYHLGCIVWFWRTAEMASLNGLGEQFPQAFWQGLERMSAVLMALGLPDGSHTQFSDDHSLFKWRTDDSLVTRLARYFKRKDVLYAATGGKEGERPAETAFSLADSGFYSMRSAWDEKATMLVLKCGADGGWHCQPDNGTFELYAGGRRLTPDSGSFSYSAGREWFRKTRVHQTLTLDGRDTAYAPKLLQWKPGKDLDVLVVENAGYPNFTHRRAVLFVAKTYFVFIDEALGEATGNAWLHFQFAPGEAVFDEKGCSARTAFKDGANLLVQALAQDGVKRVKEDGQVSFAYGKKEPRPAFRFELAKGKAPLRFVTVLAPYEGEPPAVAVKLVGSPEPGAVGVEVDVEVNGVKTRVGYALE